MGYTEGKVIIDQHFVAAFRTPNQSTYQICTIFYLSFSSSMPCVPHALIHERTAGPRTNGSSPRVGRSPPVVSYDQSLNLTTLCDFPISGPRSPFQFHVLGRCPCSPSFLSSRIACCTPCFQLIKCFLRLRKGKKDSYAPLDLVPYIRSYESTC